MLFGDSKTELGSVTTWPTPLARRGETLTGRIWRDDSVGVGGRTVATTLAAITQMFSTMPAATGATDIRVLINLGVNDITTGLPAEATWEANYLAIIDAIHAKWPTARVYLMRPWVRSFDTDSDTVAVRVGHLVAARPSFVFVGPDERIWLKGSDNGTTMTVDGTHYSVAGKLEIVNQWAAVLWP
jgi:lysophospholipase L1-like esterase